MWKVISFVQNLSKSSLRARSHTRPIISLALDDILNEEYCDPKKLVLYIKENIKDFQIHYVLLDEVQMVDNFVGALNSLLHIDNVDVYVTGSNSKFRLI